MRNRERLRAKIKLGFDQAAMLSIASSVATFLLIYLVCAIVLHCNSVVATVTPSPWLIVYPVLGLIFICVACVSWIRRWNATRRYADQVLGNSPDNVLNLKVTLVVMLTIWSLCLLASFPHWHAWASAADAVVYCLPLVVIPLLLCGFFLRDVESIAHPSAMWTMPSQDNPRDSQHTEAERSADSEIPSADTDVSLVTPAVCPEETDVRSAL